MALVLAAGSLASPPQQPDLGVSAIAMPAPAAAATLPAKGVPARIAQAEWTGTTWTGAGANNVIVEERRTPPASGAMLAIRYTRMPDGSLQTTISAEGEVRAQSVVLKRQ